jgi:ketosteroid isomerase-like protein
MTYLKGRSVAVSLLLLFAGVVLIKVLAVTKTEARGQDMSGIEKLHQQDIAATLSGDLKALSELWTEDAVRLEPGGRAEIGKQLIYAEDEKEKEERPNVKILTYAPEIKDVKVVDGWAFEWGYFNSSYRDSPNGQPKSFRGKLLRVLQKQRNGSWKFARVMWNLAE